MLPLRWIECFVGLFLLLAVTSLTVLAFKVSGLTSLFPEKTYTVIAAFDDIGGLKIRSPVKIGGVQIGEVSKIALDPVTFKAVVTLAINDKVNDIPEDSSAGIFTAGLLGDNYVAITPMYSTAYLRNGGKIEMTHSAIVLEKLIGQFLYKIGNGSNDGGSNDDKNNTGDKHANE